MSCIFSNERSDQGYCERKGRKCNGCGDLFNQLEADDDVLISREDICANASIFGNYFIRLDENKLCALKEGKCVAIVGEEYNIFIVLDKGD